MHNTLADCSSLPSWCPLTKPSGLPADPRMCWHVPALGALCTGTFFSRTAHPSGASGCEASVLHLFLIMSLTSTKHPIQLAPTCVPIGRHVLGDMNCLFVHGWKAELICSEQSVSNERLPSAYSLTLSIFVVWRF